MTEISLLALFKRSLETASKLVDLSTIQNQTQELVQSGVRDLTEVHIRIRNLSVFSPNETLDDISTTNLVYLALPFVLAEVENRIRTTGRSDRMAILTKTIDHYQAFVYQLEHYGIVPEDEKKLYSQKSSSLVDPAKRRETKVNQYKKMKEIKDRIQVLQKRRNQSSSSFGSETDFDLIASLLPSATPTTSTTEEEELESSTDEVLRTTTTLLLRMLYAQAHAQLESMEQELELLQNMPPSPSSAASSGNGNQDERTRQSQAQEQMWKLDANVGASQGLDGKGPLLDHSGRPLRPFTILPSNASERARLQAQVFGPGYNLPTMSIDEYLEIEGQRGNILTGGGKASLEQLTSSEQLQIDSEMDGTVRGEEKEEEKRQKDEKWAQYTDTHPKGAGNTMNRG